MKDNASNKAGGGGGFELHDDEVARLREENRLLRQKLDEQQEAHVHAVRLNFAVQSLSDLPVLFLDSKLRITSHTNDFIHLTRRINGLTEENQSIRKLLSQQDYKKFTSYLDRMAELDKLDYDNGDPWRLAYQGPSMGDLDSGFWQSTTNLKSCHWEITGQGQATAIVHRAHMKDRFDCYLMSRDEFGLGDEDVRLCCKLRTPSDPHNIQDLSVVLNGTAAGNNLLCDISGYTIMNGSYENSIAGVQRRTAYLLTHRESLEPDTEYFLETERVGGRISRRLKNLNTGEELAPLSAIDNKAVYDETGHVGFTTFSAGMEISEIKIHTRPSRFRIEQFRIFLEDEVGIVDPDQDMAGRTFKLRIGRSVLSGRMTYMVMFEETTERRQAEEALRESESKLQEAQQMAHRGNWFWDVKTGAVEWSAEVYRIFQLNPEEFTPQVDSILALSPFPEEQERDKELIQRAIVSREHGSYEQRFLRPDGSTGNYCSTFQGIYDDDGRLIAIKGTVQDITERKKTEQARRKSEELYRALFENINSGVAIYGAVDNGDDFVILECNKSLQKIDDISCNEWIGSKVSELSKGNEDLDLLEIFSRVWRTGQPESLPARLLKGKNKRFWLTSYISKLPGGQIVAIVDNITELKQAMDELETSREHYRNLFEDAPVCILRTTPKDGIVTAANKAAAKMFGYDSVDEFVSEFTAVKAYCDSGRRREVLESLDKDGKVSGFRNEVFRRDGSKFWIELSTRYYPEHDYYESVLIDISERREWEQKIKRLNAELEERVRRRTQQLEQVNSELESFTYSVSHDLRAPLRGIAGFGQALLEDYAGSLDRQASQYVGRMIAASKRMGQLIDELLLLSRVSRSEIKLRRMNLSHLVSAAINRLREENQGRKVEVTIEPELYCQGDKALMEAVMDNLVSNAWKFTGKRDTAQVEFGCRIIEGERVFFLRDNGAGFDEQYANKLFQPFQRLHAQSEFEGHGVGLASVQRIINRHGGRVWAEGRVDQGATFFFTVMPIREGDHDERKTDSAG